MEYEKCMDLRSLPITCQESCMTHGAPAAAEGLGAATPLLRDLIRVPGITYLPNICFSRFEHIRRSLLFKTTATTAAYRSSCCSAVQCSAVEGRPVFWLLSTNAPAVRHLARAAGRQSPSLSGYYCLLLSRPGCSTRFKQPAAPGSQGPALWLLLHQTCGCCRKAPEVISGGPGLNLVLARKHGGRNLQRVQLRKRDAQPLDARPAVIAIIFAARSGEKEARASARNFIQGGVGERRRIAVIWKTNRYLISWRVISFNFTARVLLNTSAQLRLAAFPPSSQQQTPCFSRETSEWAVAAGRRLFPLAASLLPGGPEYSSDQNVVL